jgi:2-oxoglutarate ferredoxin oxidoreductase subunit beta
MHDGSVVRFRETGEGYDPRNREGAYEHVRGCHARGEIATGLLFIDEKGQDMHALNHTVAQPLTEVPFEALCPGSKALDALMEEYR